MHHAGQAGASAQAGVGAVGKRTLVETLHSDAAPLGSFDEIVARSPGRALPSDLRTLFQAAHRVDLSPVRVHTVPMVADHGIRGLSGGDQIVVADDGDRDALEHELGHVVDSIGAGGAPPNAALDGMPLADDAAREARADELVAQAKAPARTPGKFSLAELAPRGARQAQRDTGSAPMPKLTNRASIARVGNFNWMPHKTTATPLMGGGYQAEGLGAVLQSTTTFSHRATSLHGQVDALMLTLPPEYVDTSRGPLPPPKERYDGHKGAYVVPPAMLGLAMPNNLLYLPPDALVELASIQNDMVNLATKGPGKLTVKTTFGMDGLANSVALQYDALDRVTAKPVARIQWAPVLPTVRAQWGAIPVAKATSVGTPPVTSEWKTRVQWQAPHGSGDGWHVVADKLGPDHQLGSTPSNATASNRVDALFKAAGSNEPYIAGHLLNDHLGGPGDLAANLAPIPKTANGQMSTNIEKPAKDIVNGERGWIRYEVKVTHGNDSGLAYPARIDASMAVYDHDGTLKPAKTSSIAISPPSAYAGSTAKAPKASHKLSGTALLTSPVMLDEVVLSHENDLRPFLRDSAELFELIIGSELNSNIENPKFAKAWREVQENLHRIEAIMLPDLNILSTVTDALEQWERDPIARTYLARATVSQLKASVNKALKAGELFAQQSMNDLVQANVVVKQTISPSDLFRDQRLLALARELIREAPDDRTLLQLVEARQAQTLMHHNQRRNDSLQSGNSMVLSEEDEFRDNYRLQPVSTYPKAPQSPGQFFEEYQVSGQDMMQTSMYGSTFESVRGPKAIKKLHELALAGETTTLHALLEDPVLKTSQRIEAMVGQLRRFITDRMWTESVDMPLQLELYFKDNAILWVDSLEMMGLKEPKVALQLYKLLGIT